MEAAALCGSELVLYRWDDVGQQLASLPFTPGHEGAGIVVQTGPEATLKVETVCDLRTSRVLDIGLWPGT